MIALREDAVKICFLGVEVYAFGLFAALGAALALVVLALLVRKGPWKKGTAALTGLLSGIIGLIVSRLFFGCMDGALGQLMPPWAMLRLNTGGFSMMGALLGACMGAILTAKCTKQSAPRLLDLLAPALMLFVACERLGEGYIEDFGVSRTMTDLLLQHTFLVVESGYSLRLATYLIESFLAVALCLVLLRDGARPRRAGDTFLVFLLLFGATQVLMESLRYDQHMTVKAFVKLQQIIAMMLLGAGVILLAVRGWQTKRRLAAAALASIPAAVGLGVAIEFMIDRTQISHYLLYAVFLAALSVPVILGLRLRRGVK